jgi:hypothetical protein
VAVDAAAVLSARERLAPVAVIGMDEGTNDGTMTTDDGTDGWKGRPPQMDKTKDII